jgi:phosphatidylglycerol:prolipoprotein diacylglycerol transferase
MHPIFIKMGSLTIYTYGLMVSLGFIIAVCFAFSQSKKYNLDPKIVIDLSFWILLWGFLGARILYILTEWNQFLSQPYQMLFSRGGFIFYGGFISALLAMCFYIKKRKLDFWKIADLFSPSVVLAHSIGRVGCFFYGCCYGRATNSFLGMVFPPYSPAGSSGLAVIPTQLISSLVLVIIFLLLLIIRDHQKFKGQVFLSYIFLYGLARFIIEFFRGDPRIFIGRFSISQLISILMITIALWMIRFKSKTV